MNYMINLFLFVKNKLLVVINDPVSFILFYKFIFLGYAVNVALVLYTTRNLIISQRFYYVYKSLSYIFLIQIIKFLAEYANKF